MKFLWLLRQEVKSNIFSTLLIFAELAFLTVALCICMSLSQRVLSAGGFFNRFEGRSVTASLGRADKQELAQTFDGMTELSVTVTYFHAKGVDSQTVYLGDYSKSAFDDLDLAYKGDMVDTSKDYGETVPAMVSRTLADKYKVGSIYTFKNVTVLICGELTDDYLYLMTADLTNEDFLMCWDTKGLLQTLDRSNSANGFFVIEEGDDLASFRRSLSEIPLVKGSKEFKWKDKLDEDFDRMSANLLIGALVLLLTLIGFAANNILTVKKNLSVYRALSCVGQSKPMLTLLYISRQLLCLIAAAASVLILKPKINSYLGGTMISSGSLFMCMGVCLVLIMISAAAVTISARAKYV